MKNSILAVLLLCFASTSFGQVTKFSSVFDTTIDVKSVDAYFADSASIESKPNKVIVFFTNLDKDVKNGLNVTVTSTAKFKAMFAIKKVGGNFIPLSNRTNGDFYFFGLPGIYTLVLSEFDPEKGQTFISVDGEVVGKKPPVVVDPPIEPPTGNFDNLKAVTKTASAKLNDAETSTALSQAYIKAVAEMKDLSNVETCEELARSYRRVVFSAMARNKRNLDWNSFILSVDVELKFFKTSVSEYTSALLAVAEALVK